MSLDKQALCVKADALFDSERINFSELSFEMKNRYGENGVEEDPSYLQVIPYVVLFKVGNDGEPRVAAYKRTTNSDEGRLHHKMSLGFGGHMDSPFTPEVYVKPEPVPVATLDENGEPVTLPPVEREPSRTGIDDYLLEYMTNEVCRELTEEVGVDCDVVDKLNSSIRTRVAESLRDDAIVIVPTDNDDLVDRVHLGVSILVRLDIDTMLQTSDEVGEVLWFKPKHLADNEVNQSMQNDVGQFKYTFEKWSKAVISYI